MIVMRLNSRELSSNRCCCAGLAVCGNSKCCDRGVRKITNINGVLVELADGQKYKERSFLCCKDCELAKLYLRLKKFDPQALQY